MKDDELCRDLISRMKKIEGQARGIQKMIAEGRTCSDIVVQLSAMKSAIDQVAVSVLARHIADCLDKERGKGKDIRAALEEFLPIFRKFS